MKAKKIIAAVLAAGILGICLAGCAGNTGGREAYKQLAELAADDSCELSIVEGYRQSGKTLANYLNTREWAAVEWPQDPQEVELIIDVATDQNEAQAVLRILRNQKTDEYYAEVTLPEGKGTEMAEPVFYLIPTKDTDLALAMAWLGDEKRTIHSAWPDSYGGEFALVCGGVAMGHQSHWLFRSDNGVDYMPVENNMDEVCSRVAENFLFVSEQVGFVSFRSVGDEPVLLRTADGGATWAVAELPLGGLRADQGYEDIQITTIEFWDEKNGQVTVTSHYGDSGPACVFYTEDGGESFYGVTTGGVEQ